MPAGEPPTPFVDERGRIGNQLRSLPEVTLSPTCQCLQLSIGLRTVKQSGPKGLVRLLSGSPKVLHLIAMY